MIKDNIPDKKWYMNLSKERGVAAHCPFATVESCPRYYQSLALMGEAGISTNIPKTEDKRLLRYWKSNDLWPRTSEQATSVSSSGYSKFCPEVMFDGFGYFAESLFKYADEIDKDYAHQKLEKAEALNNHPGWSWEGCSGKHFTDCPLYSVILPRGDQDHQGKSEPWWFKYLEPIAGIITKIFSG